MRLRTATSDDLAALATLVNSAYRGDSSKKGWTTEADLLGGQRTDPQTLRELIQNPQSVILLAFDDAERMIGCVYLQNQNTHGYLGMLTVAPGLQAAGLGRKLLELSEQWALDHWHLRKMEMQVIKQRTELIAWYERRGYHKTDRLKPFPYGNAKFGEPKVQGLEFVILEKGLNRS